MTAPLPDQAQDLLHRTWGFPAFRPGQEEIVSAVLSGQDVLASNGDAHATDASGNPILADVGTFLKAEIKKRCSKVDVKYIDPT